MIRYLIKYSAARCKQAACGACATCRTVAVVCAAM